MRVYTYYEKLAGNSEVPGTLQVWKDSWSRFGWEPTVLGEEDFKKHPAWEFYDAATDKLPTVNSRGYERACYRRWMAMAPLGGGLMTDYDVVNRGFFPDDLRVLEMDKLTILCHNRIPCVVFGNGHQFQKAALKLASYVLAPDDIYTSSGSPVNGTPHVSDMLIVHHWFRLPEPPRWLDEKNICCDVGELRDLPEKFKGTRLIHCSCHGSRGTDRVQVMRDMMKTGAPR